MSNSLDDLELRVQALEAKLMFQEDNLESLTRHSVEQDRQINRLQMQVKHLADKMKQQIDRKEFEATQIDNKPPPHY